MTDYPSVLGDIAQALEQSPSALNYSMRTRIERALFVTAQRTAEKYFGYHLDSFSMTACETCHRIIERGPRGQAEAAETVLQAFALQALLARLLSSDPYLACESFDGLISGRKATTLVLAGQLKKYAVRAAQMFRGHG